MKAESLCVTQIHPQNVYLHAKVKMKKIRLTSQHPGSLSAATENLPTDMFNN